MTMLHTGHTKVDLYWPCTHQHQAPGTRQWECGQQGLGKSSKGWSTDNAAHARHTSVVVQRDEQRRRAPYLAGVDDDGVVARGVVVPVLLRHLVVGAPVRVLGLDVRLARHAVQVLVQTVQQERQELLHKGGWCVTQHKWHGGDVFQQEWGWYFQVLVQPAQEERQELLHKGGLVCNPAQVARGDVFQQEWGWYFQVLVQPVQEECQELLRCDTGTSEPTGGWYASSQGWVRHLTFLLSVHLRSACRLRGVAHARVGADLRGRGFTCESCWLYPLNWGEAREHPFELAGSHGLMRRRPQSPQQIAKGKGELTLPSTGTDNG